MLCVPATRLLSVQVAVLGLPTLSVPGEQAIGLPFSLKATLPLAALPLTEAVNVMLAPSAAGFAELVSVVAVDADCTVPRAASTAAAASTMPAPHSAVVHGF